MLSLTLPFDLIQINLALARISLLESASLFACFYIIIRYFSWKIGIVLCLLATAFFGHYFVNYAYYSSASVTILLRFFLCLCFLSILAAKEIRFMSLQTAIYAYAIVCCIFSIIHIYYLSQGLLLYDVPFLDLSEHQIGMQMDGRQFLPETSAPHLSIVAALAFVILSMSVNEGMANISARSFLLLTVLLSLSKSGLVILAIYYMYINYKRMNLRVILYGMLFMVPIVYYGEFFDRLVQSLEGFEDSRHVSLRIQALELWASSPPAQLFFGNGLGSFALLGDGQYSFSSFTTILVEGGLIFLSIFVGYFIYYYKFVLKNSRHRFILLLFFSANLFYEIKTLLSFYVVLGLFISFAKESKNAG